MADIIGPMGQDPVHDGAAAARKMFEDTQIVPGLEGVHMLGQGDGLPMDPEVADMYENRRREEQEAMGAHLEDPTGHLSTSLEALSMYFNNDKNHLLPEPKMLKAAAGIIGGYFEDIKANGDYDKLFPHNVDSVVSAVGGLLEDRYEPLADKGSELDNQIHEVYARVLNSAREAAARAKTSRTANEHEPSHSRYIDIRSFTRVAEDDPDTFPTLAEIGEDCAKLLNLAADYIQTDPRLDKGATGKFDENGKYYTEVEYSSLVMKDYIHRHIGSILRAVGPYVMKHRLPEK